MKLSNLKQLIKESISTQLQLTQLQNQQNKPKLERDDLGIFYCCIKPIGGENLEQLIIPTTIMEYNDKVNGKEIAAVVNDENRARRIAERLRKGKIQELCTIKNQEIKEVENKIKQQKALQGALGQYHKLKETDPTENAKMKQKQYDQRLNELEKQKQLLLSDLEIIKQGKLPKNSAIQHQTINESSAIASLAGQLEKAVTEANDVLQKYYYETDFSEDLRKMVIGKVEKEIDPVEKQKEEEKISKQTSVKQQHTPSQTPINENKYSSTNFLKDLKNANDNLKKILIKKNINLNGLKRR